MTIFLRFDDEAAAYEAFSAWSVDGALPAYIGTAAVDWVGTITRPSGEVLHTEEGDVPEMIAEPGWHVNLSARIPELSQYEIEPPATPSRVFAGSDVPRPPTYPTFVGNAKLDLFTKDEQLAVVEATLSDPIIKLMYDRLLGAAYLTYADPEAEQGLQLLVARGLITVARKAEIVTAMQPT